MVVAPERHQGAPRHADLSSLGSHSPFSPRGLGSIRPVGRTRFRARGTRTGGGADGRAATAAAALIGAATATAAPDLPRLLAVHTPDVWIGLVILLALGWWSVRLRAHAAGSDIDLSFTAVVLLCGGVFGGPAGAALLGGLVSLASPGRVVRMVNAGMFAFVGSLAAWAYMAVGGVGIEALVDRPRASGDALGVGALARYVAWPLVVADLSLIAGNAAVLAFLFRLTGGNPRTVLSGTFARNVVIYVGYSLTAYAFIVLWGPAGVGPLAVPLIMAPLLVARWAYGQDIAERLARGRILDALGGAGRGRDGSVRRRARLRALAGLLADELNLRPRARVALLRAVDLHDVGAVALPRDEAGSQTWVRALLQHPVAGWEVLRRLDFLGEAPLAVRHHHERMDGRGYPDGLAGTEIPLSARILAVVDAYEAAAWPGSETEPGRHSQARATLREAAGPHLDPFLVVALERALHQHGLRSRDPWLDDAGSSEPSAPSHHGKTGEDGVRHAAIHVSAAVAGEARRPAPRPRPEPARRPTRRRVRRTLELLAGSACYALCLWWATASLGADHRLLLLVYGVALIAAERFRVVTVAQLPTAYAAAAVGLGFALTWGVAGQRVAVSVAEILIVTGAASLVDLIRRRRDALRDHGVYVVDAVARWAAVGMVATVARVVDTADGTPLIEAFMSRPGWWTALVMTVIVAAALTLEGLLRSGWTVWARKVRPLEAIRMSSQGWSAMGAATGATGVLIGLAQPVVGLATLPLVVAPLVVAQLAVRRQALMLRTHAQSLVALSRLPEVVGAVSDGHAHAVAELAERAGRRLGLGGRSLERLRSAALLHDVGQMALPRFIPGGATVLAAPADQEHIARMSADVARRAGVEEATVLVVEQQAVPYHEVVRDRRALGIEARVLKVANAFEDHRRARPGPQEAARAVERLYLGYGHEFDPRVVDAVARLVDAGDVAAPARNSPEPTGPGHRDSALPGQPALNA